MAEGRKDARGGAKEKPIIRKEKEPVSLEKLKNEFGINIGIDEETGEQEYP